LNSYSSRQLIVAIYLEGICHSGRDRNTRKHSRYTPYVGKLNISALFSLPSPCLKETDNSRTGVEKYLCCTGLKKAAGSDNQSGALCGFPGVSAFCPCATKNKVQEPTTTRTFGA
ncbi:MAG TPA: hypothetical protein VM783_01600, partial [Candidatus Acidoferrum sp.]|nr:hypothetical protein [Candidatus Acidoferrum sp.]